MSHVWDDEKPFFNYQRPIIYGELKHIQILLIHFYMTKKGLLFEVLFYFKLKFYYSISGVSCNSQL